MRIRNASMETIDRLMGYSTGPTMERRRGEVDRPAVLIGITPTVHPNPSGSRRAERVTDVIGRICTFITFILYVVVPVLGILGIALRS